MSIKEVIDRFRQEYRFLSNFYPAEVKLEGLKFPSVENAYQAAKNFNLDRRREFQTFTAAKSKEEGQKTVKRPDWEEVKTIIMEILVREKFTRHENLRKRLLDTGDAELIEGNNWGDVFWGVCDGKGENHLGKTLMKIRGELKDGLK